MHRRTLILAATAALAAGCEGMKKKDQASRLDQVLTAYAGAVRWGNYDAAAAFAAPRDGRPRVPDAASLEGLRVTGYSVRIDRVNDAADEAHVAISFTYYHENRGTVRRVDQNATWYLDPAREVWLLDDTLPRFAR